MTEMTEKNPYISQYEADIRRGRPVAERVRWHYCSLTLGREFRESVQAFIARKPEIAEFVKWAQAKGFLK